MIRKKIIKLSSIKQKKKDYSTKPVNQVKPGYFAKLTNQVMVSIKFNSMIFIKLFLI
jgi:hypothetical protein